MYPRPGDEGNATSELYLSFAAGGLFRKRRTSELRHRDDASSLKSARYFRTANNREENGERASGRKGRASQPDALFFSTFCPTTACSQE